MLKGRYVKGEEITEICMGGGMVQLEYVPIKCFDINNREKVIEVAEEPKRNRRGWVLWSAVVATFLCGTALGGIVQNQFYCIPLFVGTLTYIGLVVYANRK